MENNKKQKVISIVIYTILFSIIIGLSGTLYYFNDLYKEYTTPYNENCYKVEYDGNSITITKYNNSSSQICTIQKFDFKNGKLVSGYEKWIYKTKSSAKMDYKNMIRQTEQGTATYGETIKLNKNEIEITSDFVGKISYDSEEAKEKIESFTTNDEIIRYLLEDGEKNNFWMSSKYKRLD